jgi:hypothetical protein
MRPEETLAIGSLCAEMVGQPQAARLVLIKLGAVLDPLASAYGPISWQQQQHSRQQRKAPLCDNCLLDTACIATLGPRIIAKESCGGRMC